MAEKRLDEKLNKQQIRKAYRNGYYPADRDVAHQAMRDCLSEFEPYKRARVVFCFVSMENEADTKAVIEEALAASKRVAVPISKPHGQMDVKEIHGLDELAPRGNYGILEPGEEAPDVAVGDIDLALIPCVACDRQGYRVGHGGGYYDRFLADFAGTAVLWQYQERVLDLVPREEHDAKVPYLITQKGILSCGDDSEEKDEAEEAGHEV